MNCVVKIALAVSAIGAAATAIAYDNYVVHPLLTSTAANSSDLGNPSSGILTSLGLNESPTDIYLPFLWLTRSDLPDLARGDVPLFSVANLLEIGARSEDYSFFPVTNSSDTRVVRHFFDPQQGGIGLTIDNQQVGEPSPLWILEAVGGTPQDVARQTYSYRDAKEYLYSALTGTTKRERDRNLALTFISLGHVVHHIQDMTQPQHVRNDVHCSEWYACIPHPDVEWNPSAHELFAQQNPHAVPLQTYPPVDLSTFSLPGYFWQNSGRGIAEYTSNNFVSYGTNFRGDPNTLQVDAAHPNPGSSYVVVKKQITDPDVLGPNGPNQPLTGEIWFIKTPVLDNYRLSETGVNERTSTFSIFDDLLRGVDIYRERSFSLNRLTYQSANAFLLPRAVGYSAGIFNHFFRGRIEITLPDDGVMSIVDHAVVKNAAPSPPMLPEGFTKLKVNLRNVTPKPIRPDGSTAAQVTMPSGRLFAIAKYTVNPCYTTNLKGEYGFLTDGTNTIVPPLNCSLSQYLYGDEIISKSVELSAEEVPTTSKEFDFDFSQQPIPINARDLRIQVVYRGKLGDESDAIVFSGRSISEPTYLVVYNNSDYFALDGVYRTPTEIRQMMANDPALAERLRGLNIDPESMRVSVMVNSVGAGPTTLDVNHYVRLAVLTDYLPQPGQGTPTPLNLRDYFSFPSYGSGGGIFSNISPSVIETIPKNVFLRIVRITPVGEFRGMRGNGIVFVFKSNFGGATPDAAQQNWLSAQQVSDPGPTELPLVF